MTRACRLTMSGVALVLWLLVSAAAAASPEWSIILYVGTDEKQLAETYDQKLELLLTTPLPANLELIIQRDTYQPEGTFRYIRRGEGPLEKTVLPEVDSAAPEAVTAFIEWTQKNAQGRKKLFLLVTHSWGWRGIIQDYTIPGQPGRDTMLPVRELSRLMRESRFRPDVFWLDACVIGNVEPIQDLKDASPFLIVSQTETPYNGFPSEQLFAMLKNPALSPRELVRGVPEKYVQAYANNGLFLEAEGEFFITTIAGIDTAKWDGFVKDFRMLVKTLEKTDFRARLAEYPGWADSMADSIDHNADVGYFLTRLPAFVPDPRVAALATKIRADIGYPEVVAAKSRQTYTIDPGQGRRFELRIDCDDLLPAEKALEAIVRGWKETNADLAVPETLHYELINIPSISKTDRELIVTGEIEKPLVFRPWLAGTRYFHLIQANDQGRVVHRTWSRDKDYFSVDKFPQTSFLISEAHTQGAPFCQGVGFMFFPRMTAGMDRTVDPTSKLTGPDFYRSTAWNKATGWGDLMLLGPEAK